VVGLNATLIALANQCNAGVPEHHYSSKANSESSAHYDKPTAIIGIILLFGGKKRASEHCLVWTITRVPFVLFEPPSSFMS